MPFKPSCLAIISAALTLRSQRTKESFLDSGATGVLYGNCLFVVVSRLVLFIFICAELDSITHSLFYAPTVRPALPHLLLYVAAFKKYVSVVDPLEFFDLTPILSRPFPRVGTDVFNSWVKQHHRALVEVLFVFTRSVALAGELGLHLSSDDHHHVDLHRCTSYFVTVNPSLERISREAAQRVGDVAMRIVLIVLLLPHSTSPDFFERIVIWNVGQGQMITRISEKSCRHIDAGGDRAFPFAGVRRHCKNKRNELFLTHYDWDHMGYTKKLKAATVDLCLAETFPNLPLKKRKLLKTLPPCQKGNSSLFVAHRKTKRELLPLFTPEIFEENQSRAYLLDEIFLTTGDSAQEMEKKISVLMPKSRVKYFILGHHGSRTSSGFKLLQALAPLPQALVSARKKRYGHPHSQTQDRLRKHGVPLVSTEEFGNIHLMLR